jgi:hypothetical protein
VARRGELDRPRAAGTSTGGGYDRLHGHAELTGVVDAQHDAPSMQRNVCPLPTAGWVIIA